MNPFLGQIMMFGGNFAPRSWALCNGQLLPINQNQALFSLLGTIYGGDGRTTFALPDFRGRAAIGQGHGAGLTSRQLGQQGGTETVALTIAEMGQHNHTATLIAENAIGDQQNPKDNMLGATPNGPIYASVTAGTDKNMGAGSIVVNSNGNSIAHTNMGPYGVVNYIIALQGVFPSRN